MRLISLLFSFLLLKSLHGFTQNLYSEYLVLISHGQILLKDTLDKPLRSGQKLLKTDKIQIGQGAYLGLMHKNGQLLELETPGIYMVSDLLERKPIPCSKLTFKHLNAMVRDLPDFNEPPDRFKYQGVTGSVNRCPPCAGVLLIPNKTLVLAEPTEVCWKVNRYEGEVFVFELVNLFNDTTYIRKESTDPHVLIDLSVIPRNTSPLICTLHPLNQKSEMGQSASLQYIGSEGEALVKGQVDTLKRELGPENALQHLALASYYESNKLYLHAMKHYKEAIRLKPDINAFRIIYVSFLTRHELD